MARCFSLHFFSHFYVYVYKTIKLIKKNICLNVVRESRFKMMTFEPFQSFSIIYFHRKLYYSQLPSGAGFSEHPMIMWSLGSQVRKRVINLICMWMCSETFSKSQFCLLIVFLYDKRATYTHAFQSFL